MLYRLLFCLLIVGATAPLHAQELSIGQVSFRIGMTMGEAAAAVHDPIYLDPTNEGPTATWVVREKHGEKNYDIIGSIIFRDGRAETLSRELKAYTAAESHDVGNILFEALERLKEDDPSVTTTTRRVFMSSEYGEIKELTIGKGVHRIEVQIPGTNNADMVISEVMTVAKPFPGTK